MSSSVHSELKRNQKKVPLTPHYECMRSVKKQPPEVSYKKGVPKNS